MATKVFKEYKGWKLVGDERDIMVSSKHHLEVLDWCDANDIDAELSMGSTSSSLAASTFGAVLWRVKDEKQRLAFVLRWS